MPFPASTQVQVDALQKVRSAALQIKAQAQRQRDLMAAGSVEGAVIISLLNKLRETISVFDEVAAVPGIGAYAQAQYDDASLDISAEFSSMRSAAVGARDWIINNLPTDADGYLLLQTMDASGLIVWRSFSSSATGGLRSELDALIATIS